MSKQIENTEILERHIEFLKEAMEEVGIDPESRFGREFIKLETQVINHIKNGVNVTVTSITESPEFDSKKYVEELKKQKEKTLNQIKRGLCSP